MARDRPEVLNEGELPRVRRLAGVGATKTEINYAKKGRRIDTTRFYRQQRVAWTESTNRDARTHVAYSTYYLLYASYCGPLTATSAN